MEIVRQLQSVQSQSDSDSNEEESENLIRWHNSHKHLESVGSNIDYAGVRKLHIKNEYIRQLFQKVENHCIGEIYKATGKVFYPEMSAHQ